LYQLFIRSLYKEFKQQRIACQVKQMDGEQQYGNRFLQDKILLNLKRISQTVTHILNCNLSAVVHSVHNCLGALEMRLLYVMKY
jgi:hypothetical protein